MANDLQGVEFVQISVANGVACCVGGCDLFASGFYGNEAIQILRNLVLKLINDLASYNLTASTS